MIDSDWHEMFLKDETIFIVKGIIYTVAIGFSIPVVMTFAYIGIDTYKALKHFFRKFQ